MRTAKVVVVFVMLLSIIISLCVLWWYKSGEDKPYVFTSVRYGISKNWYAVDFQPIYLRQYDRDGDKYMLVLYKNQRGLPSLGVVLVGSKYGDHDPLPMAPYLTSKTDNAIDPEVEGYKYPSFPGKRIRVLYLVSSTPITTNELREVCTNNERICQAAEVVRKLNQISKTIDNNGLTPPSPIVAIAVYKDLESEVIKVSK